jgi:hypothetical protein
MLPGGFLASCPGRAGCRRGIWGVAAAMMASPPCSAPIWAVLPRLHLYAFISLVRVLVG